MRKVLLTLPIAMVGFFLFLGCNREELIQNQTSIKNATNDQIFVHLDSLPNVKNYLARTLSQVSGLRNSFFASSDIDISRVLIREYSPAEITYSMPIASDTSDNWTYNIVILKENGVFTNSKVVAIQHLSNYEFGMYQYSVEEAFGTGGGRGATLKECWKQYYNVISSTNGNGTGSPGTGDGTGGGGGFGGYGGGVVSINGYWSGGSLGGSGTGSGNGSGGSGSGGSGGGSGGSGCDGSWLYFMTPGGIFRLCIPPMWDDKIALTDNQGAGSRTLTPECKKLLVRYGFIDDDCNMKEDYGEKLVNDCRKANPELSKRINDAANGSSIIHPCTGASFNYDADQVEKALCFNGEFSEEGFDKWINDQLDGVDHIDLNKVPLHLMNCDKTPAQNLADFGTFMQANNGCSKEGFAAALDSYLGFGSTIDIGNTPLSAGNKLCPNSIQVTPSTWDPTRQNVAGITGLQISLNGGINLAYTNLFFKVDQTGDCGITTEQLISQAINSSILVANNNILANKPIYENGSLPNNSQFAQLIDNEIKRIANSLGCKAKYDPKANQTTTPPGFDSQTIPSAFKNSIIRDYHCGAKFVAFSAMQTGC